MNERNLAIATVLSTLMFIIIVSVYKKLNSDDKVQETKPPMPALTLQEISRAEAICKERGGLKDVKNDRCYGAGCRHSKLPWVVSCVNGYNILMERDQNRP